MPARTPRQVEEELANNGIHRTYPVTWITSLGNTRFGYFMSIDESLQAVVIACNGRLLLPPGILIAADPKLEAIDADQIATYGPKTPDNPRWKGIKQC